MPIPNFQAVFLPLLKDLALGERTSQETVAALAQQFDLTPDELAARGPSGKQPKFANRVAWAKVHLKAAGLAESPRRGVYRLTQLGRETLAHGPEQIDIKYLERFPSYNAFRYGDAEKRDGILTKIDEQAKDIGTPDEVIEEGFQQYRAALATELRERIAAMPPAAFEQLVVDLLQAMGYGGPQEDAGLVIGRGGDEGIDGVIKEDRLGLETIYVQAKRWQGTVGRPEIQRFAGALQGHRARKGVFITTSSFTKEAASYASSIQTTIVLVDGAQLAEFMIDHDVGVTTVKTYQIKKIDSDYFSGE
jgi:restriction system protein